MRPRTPILASAVTVLAASLLVAGCGGKTPTTTADTATASAQTGLFAYSHCMRSHGIPNFPDPVAGEGIPKDKLIPLVGSPQFSTATRACQHIMPASGLGPQTAATPTRVRLAAALAFARCMRDRGFRTFPDPTRQGQLTPQMVTAAGLDLHQPAVLQAGLACAPVTHGLITRAAVERAVNGG